MGGNDKSQEFLGVTPHRVMMHIPTCLAVTNRRVGGYCQLCDADHSTEKVSRTSQGVDPLAAGDSLPQIRKQRIGTGQSTPLVRPEVLCSRRAVPAEPVQRPGLCRTILRHAMALTFGSGGSWCEHIRDVTERRDARDDGHARGHTHIGRPERAGTGWRLPYQGAITRMAA